LIEPGRFLRACQSPHGVIVRTDAFTSCKRGGRPSSPVARGPGSRRGSPGSSQSRRRRYLSAQAVHARTSARQSPRDAASRSGATGPVTAHRRDRTSFGASGSGAWALFAPSMTAASWLRRRRAGILRRSRVPRKGEALINGGSFGSRLHTGRRMGVRRFAFAIGLAGALSNAGCAVYGSAESAVVTIQGDAASVSADRWEGTVECGPAAGRAPCSAGSRREQIRSSSSPSEGGPAQPGR
jgi:hypothetical protein